MKKRLLLICLISMLSMLSIQVFGADEQQPKRHLKPNEKVIALSETIMMKVCSYSGKTIVRPVKDGTKVVVIPIDKNVNLVNWLVVCGNDVLCDDKELPVYIDDEGFRIIYPNQKKEEKKCWILRHPWYTTTIAAILIGIIIAASSGGGDDHSSSSGGGMSSGGQGN